MDQLSAELRKTLGKVQRLPFTVYRSPFAVRRSPRAARAQRGAVRLSRKRVSEKWGMRTVGWRRFGRGKAERFAPQFGHLQKVASGNLHPDEGARRLRGFNPISANLLPESSSSLNRARYRARARIPSFRGKDEVE
jgi:hypothetical protein